jgi:preprotein translocase subunit SecG
VITLIVVSIHTLVALTLILVVLLQVGKGGSIGAAFGGGGSSQTLFGSRGPATFLSRLTTVAAALFMVTSLSLAYLSSNARNRSSITGQVPAMEERIPTPQEPAADGGASGQPPASQTPANEEGPAPPGGTQ